MSGAGVGGKLRIEDERMELPGVRGGVGPELEVPGWYGLDDIPYPRVLVVSVRRKLRSTVWSGKTCA